jgi:RES domain-containing protein
MLVYRISDCRYINDLSGKGAAQFGGRWNNKDIHILYTAATPSLALLETLVHMGRLPLKPYCMATIDVPELVMQEMTDEDLPPGWKRSQAPDFLKAIGDKFIMKCEYVGLKVPSAIMPEEFNLLLNPAHALFSKVKILVERQIVIDERLLPLS